MLKEPLALSSIKGAFSAAILAAPIFASVAAAETVVVKYRSDPVPLDAFVCTDVDRSSFIRRVCYDAPNSYMLIQLNKTYYHYCGINGVTVDALMEAASMGSYYNANIKGNFDCRIGRVPEYSGVTE